jgi:glycosyltransferase involved in cell wall biosynthesis
VISSGSSQLLHRPAAEHPIVEALRSVVDVGDYIALLRRSAELAELARCAVDPAALAHDLQVLAADGPVSSLVAIESLAGVDHQFADDALTDLLTHPAQIVRRHAAWRLADRLPSERALPALLEMITVGGIDTMHAHRTLRRWSGSSSGRSIVRAVIAALIAAHDPVARARLVDLLGVLGGDADPVLLHLALDESQATTVRVAAIGALGERECPPGDLDRQLERLAAFDEALGLESALALVSRRLDQPPSLDRSARDGVRVAQLVLAHGLDGQLSLGGRGDTGGVASLLVSLGEAMARRNDVEHVLTIGRGTVADAVIGPLSSSRIPLSYGMVAFGDEDRPADTPDHIWEHLPAIERGIRRALRLSGPVDVLHLRMADAGTLAGVGVATEMGIPVCFSVAPDPHNVIESLQARGELDDETFVQLATDTHVWFRARLIERVAREADQLALFPRSKPITFLDNLGGDSRDVRQNIAVVAEGIDISLLDRASAALAAPVGDPRPGDVLDELASRLDPSRRHLPLVISVGRLNPVKGMDRVVAAWAADPQLHDACNLVIVGGDLDTPSVIEAGVLDTIDRLVPIADPRRAGIVLLGGRPRTDIARLLVATSTGRPDAWAGGGIYVDGAVKEEFGLAVLEAMAAGLVVVAPSTGGPSTYVDHGDTGILVAPGADLGTAISEAFGLVPRMGRGERARRLVEQRYSIETMAAQLVDLYQPAMAMQ